ncbi:glycosyltransferase family 4 protein [Niabella insulamsoli]|uniref:glycosyltransferase family 4 protein n=1 Tax=Niabella insulamsoli TaxID=3144874 RepID=UPI0031FC7B28
MPVISLCSVPNGGKHFVKLEKYLHIVCLDAPCPANCGGSIDMLNRIKAFHQKGIRIHLHYFNFSDKCCAAELSRYCETVQSYAKKDPLGCVSLNTPGFVSARCNEKLIENLNKDNHPVLLEGLHTTGILNSIHKGDRRICVRMHNEESVYYRELARNTINPVKKTYYIAESLLTKKYTPTLPDDCMYACVTDDDKNSFAEQGFPNVQVIPPFPSWQEVDCPTGVGSLCLFHGNLAVPATEKAALWLLSNVFNKVRIPFVIAGKNPTRSIQKAADLCQNTCLVSNPCESEMEDLVQKAHINILPCFHKNRTGIRMKLLHALYKGRHCITTPAMVEGTGLEAACHIGNNSNALASIISQLYYLPFEEEEVKLRKRLLEDTYNNERNIQTFIDYLW